MTDRRVPADWESQAAIWLTWPHNRATWPGRFEPVPAVYREMVRLISEVVPVHLLADDEIIRAESASLGDSDSVRWFSIQTNDSWIRDYGPTFVTGPAGPNFVTGPAGEKMHVVSWHYNAWGKKYPPWDKDNAAAEQMAQRLQMPVVRSSLCVEGGALEWDGTGRLLTTTDCLITDTRNPGWTKPQVEHHLRTLTGVREITWIDGGGLQGDDTDGHIDQLARFVDTENVVAAICQENSDPNAAGLDENFRQLSVWAKQTEPQVTVHRLPVPPPRWIDGQRVPESYCNFLRLGESRMLVPTFRSPKTDDAAIEILRELSQIRFPDTEVIGVDCSDLVWGLGALHCASLNQPAC